MSGGHWKIPNFNNQTKYTTFPLVKRSGSSSLVNFLEVTGTDTKSSTDPLLISKPTSPKLKNKAHESDRNVQVTSLTSGSGEVSASQSSSKPVSELESGHSSESDLDIDELEEIKVEALQLKNRKRLATEPSNSVSEGVSEVKKSKGWKFKILN